MDFPFWQFPLASVLDQLSSGPEGLKSEEAATRLAQYGPNIFTTHRQRALFLEFLARFRNPLVILLLAASGISALTGEVTSFFIISLIVLMSVTLDFIQEHRAGQAAERLKQSVAVRVAALRDGKTQEVPVGEVVPGDVVLLSAGDLVPADGRVLEAKDFFVNQALLTGEPYPVEKHPSPSPAAAMGEAVDAVFMGTSTVSGSAKVLICATGADTA